MWCVAPLVMNEGKSLGQGYNRPTGCSAEKTSHATFNFQFTHNQYTERQNKQHITTQRFGRVRAVPRLCGFYPGICLTTEDKARKILSQSSRRVSAGTIKIHKHKIRINRRKNEDT